MRFLFSDTLSGDYEKLSRLIFNFISYVYPLANTIELVLDK